MSDDSARKPFPPLHLSMEGVGGAPLDATRQTRQTRRDAIESRRRILATAQTLFAEHGVGAVSMRQVALAAGIGHGTLYRHFAHKGLLAAALLTERAGRLHDELRARLDPPASAPPALERLDAFFAHLAAFTEENAALLSAMENTAAGARRMDVYRSPFYRWLRETLIWLLSQAQASGEIAPLDVEYTADAALALLTVDLYHHQRETLGFSQARILAGLRRMLFDGLRGGRE